MCTHIIEDSITDAGMVSVAPRGCSPYSEQQSLTNTHFQHTYKIIALPCLRIYKFSLVPGINSV